MDRAVRIIPFAVAMVFALWAYLVFDRTMSDTISTPTTAESLEAAREAERFGAEDPTRSGTDGASGEDLEGAPDDLAFRPSFGAGTYRVSDEVEGLEEILALDDDDDDADDEGPLGGDLLPMANPASPAALGPGMYTTSFDTAGCSYELRRTDPKTRHDRVIGQEQLADGRLIVALNDIEPDLFLPNSDCGRWTLWSAPARPLVSVGTGDYWIGDLAPGRWSVPPGCLWEEVADFRGARLADVVSSGYGPEPLMIDDETLGIRFRNCEWSMELVEPLPVEPLPFEPLPLGQP